MSKKRNISIGVGVFVLSPDYISNVVKGKILVTKRRAGSSWGQGSIALPGGHVEEFEKAYDCAVRETLEETGLVVAPILLDCHTYVFHAEEWFRQGKHHWTIYMAAEIVGGVLANPEPHKHEDWRWASVDDLAKTCGPEDWIPVKALLANRHKIGL